MKFFRLLIFLIISLCFSAYSFSQRGKDGAKTISAVGTIVNEYTNLTSDAIPGSTILTVGNSSLNSNGRFSNSLSPGDLIIVIQVQGATIKSLVQTKQWGGIISYNNCGLYEFAQVLSVPNSTGITLECGLENNYTTSGKTVVVRVPRYSSLSINNGGELTGEPWNGTVGGILAIEVLGNTVVNAGGKISMSDKGFRGGAINDDNSAVGIGEYFSPADDYGSEKGEGIAGYQTDYDALGGRFCRGAPANGGGGANAHNHGGGGGSNAGDTSLWSGTGNPDISNASWIQAWNLESANFAISSSTGGGRGGYSFSSNDENALVVGTANPLWGGDNRNNCGGLGGRPLDYSTGRIFIGGGGGAGDQNDNYGTIGANGGGIIFVRSYADISGNGQIISDGSAAANTASGTGFGSGGADGAGGGGGGGTIILQSTGTISGISASANGGNGGSQVINGFYNLTQSQAEGTGGGGGGGYIAVSNGAIVRTAIGGNNGTTNSSGVTEFPPNGATKGGAGIDNASVPVFYIIANDDTVCSGNSATISASLAGLPPSPVTIFWYDALVGGNVLATGASFTTPALTSTTTYYVGTCPGTYHHPVTVYIDTASAQAGNDVTICTSGSVQLNATGGVNYQWSPAAGLSNTAISNPVASPATTTYYYVTVTSPAGCIAVDSVKVTVSNTLNASAGNDVSVCPGMSTNLQASGGTSYAWSPSSGLSNTAIANPVASPVNTTSYIVTVSTGAGCSDADTVVVSVFSAVLANAGNDTSLCTGSSLQLQAGGGVSYNWSPIAGLSNPSISNPVANPANTTVYSVTVTDNNGCTGSDDITINVGLGLNISITPNPAVICSGQSIALTASGGLNYVWSPLSGLSSSTGSSVFASPASTIKYSVTGTDASGCSGTAEVTVIVSPGPVAGFTSWQSSSVDFSGEVNFTDISTGNIISWQWNFGDGSSPVIGQSVVHNYPDVGSYMVTLSVTDSFGCSDTYTDSITINDIFTLYIPNSFTPNDNGINDGFTPKGISIDPSNYKMFIFNRWGNLVFYTEKWGESWNGTSENNGVSDDALMDVYVYKIICRDLTGIVHQFIGSVNLIN